MVQGSILEHVSLHGLSEVEDVVELFLAEHVHSEHVLAGETVGVGGVRLTRAVSWLAQQCCQWTGRAQSVQGQATRRV